MKKTIRSISPVLVKNLLSLAKAYADATGVKLTTVGANSTKTATFFIDLEEGRTSCTLRKYDLLTKWFSDKWPEDHPMPKLQDPRHYPNEGKPDVDEVEDRPEAKPKKAKSGSGKKEARGSRSGTKARSRA
jgi:hypothetical protein